MIKNAPLAIGELARGRSKLSGVSVVLDLVIVGVELGLLDIVEADASFVL